LKRTALLVSAAAAFALGAALAIRAPLAADPSHPAPVAKASPALDRFRALAGEWSGSGGEMGDFTATWRVTGGGSAVVETLFPGTPHEMVTVYHADGDDLVLTHYCALGNQPRMRARAASSAAGSAFAFEFDGGSNIDPEHDEHMHRASF
jgi:hypothetical protein